MDASPTTAHETWLDVSFLGIDRLPIRRLRGFRPGVHRLPQRADLQADSFVHDIAREELDEELERVHADLRQHFGLRRRQLRPGPGSIHTPAFAFYISAQVDPDDPSRARLSRELCEIRDPRCLEHPGFDPCFTARFDRIEVRHRGALDMADLIDGAEDAGLPVDYPRDLASAELTLLDAGICLHVQAHRVTARSLLGSDSSQLAAGFMRAAIGLAERDLHILPRVDAPTRTAIES